MKAKCYLCDDKAVTRIKNIAVCDWCVDRWMPQEKAHPTDAELPKVMPDLGFLDMDFSMGADGIEMGHYDSTGNWVPSP